MAITIDSVRWFKYRAKRLLKAHRAGDQEATARIKDRVRSMAHVHLQKVQHVVVVEAGFSNWKAMLDATDLEWAEAIVRLCREAREEEADGQG